MLHHARGPSSAETDGPRGNAVCRGLEAWRCLKRSEACRCRYIILPRALRARSGLFGNNVRSLRRGNRSILKWDHCTKSRSQPKHLWATPYRWKGTNAEIASRVPICIPDARHGARRIEKGRKHVSACFHPLSKNPFGSCATAVGSMSEYFLLVTNLR